MTLEELKGHVDTCLTSLLVTPSAYAIARKAARDAKNKRERVFQRLVLSASGSNDIRKAEATVNVEYIKAQEKESEALFELECQQDLREGGIMACEIYRTENANARAAERIR